MRSLLVAGRRQPHAGTSGRGSAATLGCGAATGAQRCSAPPAGPPDGSERRTAGPKLQRCLPHSPQLLLPSKPPPPEPGGTLVARVHGRQRGVSRQPLRCRHGSVTNELRCRRGRRPAQVYPPRSSRLPGPREREVSGRRAATFRAAAARGAHLRAGRAAGGQGRRKRRVVSGEGRGGVGRGARAAGRAPVPRLSREGGAAGRGARAAEGSRTRSPARP